jgi:hypothetical protein
MQEVENTNLSKDDSIYTTMLAYTYKKHEYEKDKNAHVARFEHLLKPLQDATHELYV